MSIKKQLQREMKAIGKATDAARKVYEDQPV